MRVIRYRDRASAPRFGVVENDVAYAVDGDPLVGAVHRTGEIGPVEHLTLLPPVVPGKIVCVGLNYLAHVTERDPNRKVPTEPVLFMKPPSALVGSGHPIEIAHPDHRTDYEAELVVVVGAGGRDIPEATALDHVFGYTCGNDVSDRDLQKQDGQFVRAKSFHTYCPLGPWIETDLDPTDVSVRSRLNGELRQDQRTSSMLFGPAFLVAFVSSVMTLDRGDIIMTGTPENVGPLVAGDTIEVEIGGIGILRNPVVNAR